MIYFKNKSQFVSIIFIVFLFPIKNLYAQNIPQHIQNEYKYDWFLTMKSYKGHTWLKMTPNNIGGVNMVQEPTKYVTYLDNTIYSGDCGYLDFSEITYGSTDRKKISFLIKPRSTSMDISLHTTLNWKYLKEFNCYGYQSDDGDISLVKYTTYITARLGN